MRILAEFSDELFHSCQEIAEKVSNILIGANEVAESLQGLGLAKSSVQHSPEPTGNEILHHRGLRRALKHNKIVREELHMIPKAGIFSSATPT